MTPTEAKSHPADNLEEVKSVGKNQTKTKQLQYIVGEEIPS